MKIAEVTNVDFSLRHFLLPLMRGARDRGHEVVTALHEVQARHEQAWAAEVGADRWATTREVLVRLFNR